VFEIKLDKNNDVYLSGRFDATQVDKAYEVFDRIQTSGKVDFTNLDYISSAGLGVLLKTQKRLKDRGEAMKLVNMNQHVRKVFTYAGFDIIFEIT
jgi:anti-sigma B factor antagonist